MPCYQLLDAGIQVLGMVLRIRGNWLIWLKRLDLFPQRGNPLRNFDPRSAKGAS